MADIMTRLADFVTTETGRAFKPERLRRVGGGSISEAFILEAVTGTRVFVKKYPSAGDDLFTAEIDGLAALARCSDLRVPRALGLIRHEADVYLVLEYIRMDGRSDGRRLARSIAALHRISGDFFGWTRDNRIGSTPQPNTPSDTWIDFFRHQRLAHQRRQLQRAGAPNPLLADVAALEENLEAFFAGYQPRPALVHGDLWSGNWAFTPDGDPVVFDPAVHFGDHEADLAMMELFGHPGEAFFSEYASLHPIHEGYRLRRDLYNLYHILNHALLFGGGYIGQAGDMARRLLRHT